MYGSASQAPRLPALRSKPRQSNSDLFSLPPCIQSFLTLLTLYEPAFRERGPGPEDTPFAVMTVTALHRSRSTLRQSCRRESAARHCSGPVCDDTSSSARTHLQLSSRRATSRPRKSAAQHRSSPAATHPLPPALTFSSPVAGLQAARANQQPDLLRPRLRRPACHPRPLTTTAVKRPAQTPQAAEPASDKRSRQRVRLSAIAGPDRISTYHPIFHRKASQRVPRQGNRCTRGHCAEHRCSSSPPFQRQYSPDRPFRHCGRWHRIPPYRSDRPRDDP